MKKVFIYYFIVLSICSCKSQTSIIELDNKDLAVFEFRKDNINILNNKYVTEIYNNQKKLITTQEWRDYGYGYFEKKYTFIKNKDTMNLKCLSGQGVNFYFKDIIFQKGDYQLKFEMPKTTIKGSKIQVNNELKKTIFMDAYIRNNKNTIFKNTQFKNLDFYKISLNDKGVVWKKLDNNK